MRLEQAPRSRKKFQSEYSPLVSQPGHSAVAQFRTPWARLAPSTRRKRSRPVWPRLPPLGAPPANQGCAPAETGSSGPHRRAKRNDTRKPKPNRPHLKVRTRSPSSRPDQSANELRPVQTLYPWRPAPPPLAAPSRAPACSNSRPQSVIEEYCRARRLPLPHSTSGSHPSQCRSR